MPNIGQQIRSARLSRGLTQQELAAAAGMAQPDVSRIERGLTNPTVHTAERLFEVVGKKARISARQGQLRIPGVLRPVSHSDNAPAVEWLVEGVLARGAVTLLAGAPGAGKSLLAQSFAAAAVNGSGGVAGITVEPARVMLIDAENGEGLIQRRFAALGLGAVAWGTRLRVLEAEGWDLVADLPQLDSALTDDACDVLILDAWVSLWSGSEASVDAVKQCLGGLRELSQRHRMGTLLIHHTVKAKGAATYRGSGAIAGTIEAVFTLTRGEAESERVLACNKMRLGPEPPVRTLEVSEAGFRGLHRLD